MSTPRTLYASRRLLSSQALVDWAKAAGFPSVLDDMHATIAFSRAPLDWDALPPMLFEGIVAAGGERALEAFGSAGDAIVLRFDSPAMTARWQQIRDAGGSWDWPGYQPHVTISYQGAGVDLATVEPFTGPLEFGPERFAEVDEDWKANAVEKAASRMAPTLSMFIPITKIDTAKRLVYGIATAETEDRAGEVCDYATTKPLYEKWSGDIAKATDGKSLGNVRAMHGNVAAGKVTQIAFQDEQKQIEICAKVVDEAEWQKVVEGVYTGFSQGGEYVKRWKDDAGLMRYTADPHEVSLVDLPCLPSATFQLIKADGLAEVRHFATIEKEATVPDALPSNDDVARFAHDLAKAAGDEAKWFDHIEVSGRILATALAKGWTAGGDLADAAKLGVVEPAPVAPAAEPVAVPVVAKAADPTPVVEAPKPVEADAPQWEQVWKTADGSTFKTKAEAVKHAGDLSKAAAPADPADAAMDALASALKKDAPAEVAAPVVVTDRDLLTLDVGKFAGGFAAKFGLIKRARVLKALDALPSGWVANVAKSLDFYGLANMLQLLDSLRWAEDCLESDSYWPDTANATPELKARFGAMLTEFGAIVAESLDIVLATMSDEERGGAMALSLALGDLAKAGARHSKADKATLNAAHDALVKLGADCGMEKAVGADDLAKGASDLAKALADNSVLKERLEKALPLIEGATSEIALLRAEVKKLADTPASMPPARFDVRDAPGNDEITAIAKAVEGGNSETVAHELIKASFRRPMQFTPIAQLAPMPIAAPAPAESAGQVVQPAA